MKRRKRCSERRTSGERGGGGISRPQSHEVTYGSAAARQFLGSELEGEVWRRSRSNKQHQFIKDKFCQADLIKTLDQITQVGDEVLALSRKG